MSILQIIFAILIMGALLIAVGCAFVGLMRDGMEEEQAEKETEKLIEK